jgi:hypothetical protein
MLWLVLFDVGDSMPMRVPQYGALGSVRRTQGQCPGVPDGTPYRTSAVEIDDG